MTDKPTIPPGSMPTLEDGTPAVTSYRGTPGYPGSPGVSRTTPSTHCPGQGYPCPHEPAALRPTNEIDWAQIKRGQAHEFDHLANVASGYGQHRVANTCWGMSSWLRDEARKEAQRTEDVTPDGGLL